MRTIGLAIAVAAASLAFAPTTRAQQTEGFQDETREDVHRGLQLATAGSMLVTGTLGTILAINKPTLFSEGRCAEGEPIFGWYGCHGLSILHGVSAVITLVLYTATTTLELAEGTWPGSGGHNDGYTVASAITMGAMGALPIVGFIAAVPAIFGIPEGDFQKVLRTLHLSVAYLAVGTYVTTVALDL
jgi:hypothetical protein